MTTITVPRELLEQALSALDAGHQFGSNQELVDALRAALAAPQEEPWPQLLLDNFTICNDRDKVLITHRSGESGQFDAGKFEACVAEFFREPT